MRQIKSSKALLARITFAAVILMLVLPLASFAQTTNQNNSAVNPQYDPGFICKQIQNIADIRNYSLGQCVRQLYNFALGISGLIAMGVLVAAGYYYMTAGGDGEQVSHAKEMIGGAISGIIILATAYIILMFLDPRLVNIRNNPTIPSLPSQSTPASTPATGGSAQITQPSQNGVVSVNTLAFKAAVVNPPGIGNPTYARYNIMRPDSTTAGCIVATNQLSGDYPCTIGNISLYPNGGYTVTLTVRYQNNQTLTSPAVAFSVQRPN